MLSASPEKLNLKTEDLKQQFVQNSLGRYINIVVDTVKLLM